MGNQKKAALYCRMAQPDQMMIELQKHTVFEYAKSKGYAIQGIVTDQEPGTAMERAGLKCIMHMAQSNEIDVLVAVSVSRIGRNVADLLHFVKELQSAGVAVDTAKEGMLTPFLLDPWA